MTTPPPQDVPEVIRVLDRFRDQLLRGEAQAATRLIRAYAPIFARLTTDIDALLLQIENQQLTITQTLKLNRLQALQRQIEAELATFSQFADGSISLAQAENVNLSAARNRAVVNAALPPGINLNTLADIGIEWNQLPAQAIDAFVGVSGDGAPLANLLDTIGPEVRQGVTQEIMDGIARGRSPRESARLIRNRVGMGLTRSLRISRTESLRSYREATRLSYQQNSNIVRGYTRHAKKDGRTCMACLALDGKRYPLNVPLNEHISGRCQPSGALVFGAKPSASSKRFYVGELVTIKVSSGIELTVTPNHPVLTSSGWKPSGLIHEGDSVISSPRKQSAVSDINVNYQDVPSLIEQIFESFSVVTLPMPSTSEHFHGDGEGSQVHVIGTDSLLRRDIQSSFQHPTLQSVLGVADPGSTALLSLSPVAKGFPGSLHSPGCLLSNGDSSVMLLDRCLRSEQPGSLSLGASYYPGLFESEYDRSPTNPQFGGEALFGLPRNVFPDNVVSVERQAFSGHVYSLQTNTGWYISRDSVTPTVDAGIVTSNCALVPETIQYSDLGLDVPDQDLTRELGPEWFAKQPSSVQLDMMGPARHKAWKAGGFEFTDQAKLIPSRVWGEQAVTKPLKELVS